MNSLGAAAALIAAIHGAITILLIILARLELPLTKSATSRRERPDNSVGGTAPRSQDHTARIEDADGQFR